MEKITKCWNSIGKIGKKYGYNELVHNGFSLSHGSTFYKADKDKFAPIITFNIWGNEVSIHVQDRNGNTILTGETVAIHILKNCKDFEKKFNQMCGYVFDKYSKYSKQNRLDFAFNELQEERILWNEK